MAANPRLEMMNFPIRQEPCPDRLILQTTATSIASGPERAILAFLLYHPRQLTPRLFALWQVKPTTRDELQFLSRDIDYD